MIVFPGRGKAPFSVYIEKLIGRTRSHSLGRGSGCGLQSKSEEVSNWSHKKGITQLRDWKCQVPYLIETIKVVTPQDWSSYGFCRPNEENGGIIDTKG